MLTALSSMALLEAQEVACGRDARGAASALKQPTDFRALRLANLGKGQLHTSVHTHTHKHNVQNIYLELLAQHAQPTFHPAHLLAAAHSAPNPLDLSACLERTVPSHRSTKHNRGRQPRQEIHPPPEDHGAHFGPLPTSKHRPWQESGLALGHHPSPSREPGESRSATLATRFPLLKEKALKKQGTFPFSTWKILVQYQFGGLEESCWQQRGEEVRRCIGGPYAKHHKLRFWYFQPSFTSEQQSYWHSGFFPPSLL